ncbi:hypothetical protein MNV49_005025 [Pseudohyphozyma bogoriensis]|nr:hypothetical protein MNV49_005025 [Pseudohyphozyma bogoriensis]
MSSAADQKFREVLLQLQTQHEAASRQLSMVRSQLGGRERDRKVTTLTLREIEALPRAGPTAPACYKGVGRMFMQESRNNIENTLKAKEKEIGEEMTVLAKKAKYLEGEMQTAQGSLRDILQNQER